MTEIIIEKAKAVAFTGHRILQSDFKREFLKEIIENLIDQGYNTFLVGMAVGFDSECFRILEQIRERKEIYIVACIPCKNQSDKFNFEQKKEYKRMVLSADGCKLISQEYTPWCMQKRNEFMVDNAAILISYLRQNYGGTANTVRYAQKKNIKIINL